LYDNLAFLTAMTMLMTTAATAALEGITAITTDITGAFLNSSVEPTGVIVSMVLDKFAKFVREDGSSVVELDKAL